jgi:hemolysin activation/secretion protein
MSLNLFCVQEETGLRFMGKLDNSNRADRTWGMAGLALATAILLPNPLLAVEIPSAVEPSRVTSGFEGPREPVLKAPGEALPAFPESVQLPPPPTREVVRFILKRVSVEGATVYTQDQLKPLYAESVGKIVPVPEAQAIANRITTRYREDGYVLSQAVVPRQDLRDGTLHIRVVEGFVDRVIIEGDGKDADGRGLVEQYGEKITRDRPLRIDTLERYLLLMNDLPGVTARSVLQPSPDAFGAANLVVSLTRKRVDSTLATDNRVTRYLGSLQQNATLAVNSVAGLEERTQLQAGMADPARAMHFLGIQHEEQLGSEGTRLVLAASQTRTQPGSTLTPLELEAVANDVQITLQHPFIRLRTDTLTGRLAFDYRNTDTTVFRTTTLTSDRVRAVRLGGNYTVADRWQGTDLLDLQASRGLSVFNASASGDVRSQAAAPAGFTKLNLDASRIQPLPGAFSLFTGFSLQVSANPLLAAEQFTVGGPAFGSAYDPGVLAGDHGAAARVELRYGGDVSGQVPLSYQAYGFYDVGAVWDKTKTPAANSLASTGLGLRLGLTPHLSGAAELAVPLTRGTSLGINDHAPRLLFSMQGIF